jgi:rubrerythrin
MTTLTPTKDTGSESKATSLHYVDPACRTSDDRIRERLAAVRGVDAVYLADTLSAFLTHERCGTHLYKAAAARVVNPMLKSKFEEFGKETMRHVEILEGLITSSGGNPNYVSSMARAVEAMDSKTLEATFTTSGSIDAMVTDMALLDAVFVAEAVDQANWQTMRQIAEKLEAGEVRDAFEAAVEEVEAQEDEHLAWARETKAKMTVMQIDHGLMAKAGAKVEEVVAKLKS